VEPFIVRESGAAWQTMPLVRWLISEIPVFLCVRVQIRCIGKQRVIVIFVTSSATTNLDALTSAKNTRSCLPSTLIFSTDAGNAVNSIVSFDLGSQRMKGQQRVYWFMFDLGQHKAGRKHVFVEISRF
jgi:hypothetical protein